MATKTTQSPNGDQPPSLTIDWEEFGHHLDDSDLSDEQKQEFIETLWSIVVSCVDLGFEIAPVQEACEGQMPEAGGQKSEMGIFLPADLIKSEARNPKSETRTSTSKGESLQTSDILNSAFRTKEES